MASKQQPSAVGEEGERGGRGEGEGRGRGVERGGRGEGEERERVMVLKIPSNWIN